MPKKDYYQVLGIDKKATEAEIKKAYKKLAIKWHPDKNLDNKDEAVQKFREISEAYENLTDKEKRQAYDSYGFQGPKSNNFHHFNFNDANNLFSQFFKNHQFDDDPFFSNVFGRNNGSSRGNGMGGMGMGMGGMGGMGGFGGGFGTGGSLFDSDPFFKDMGLGGGSRGGYTSFSSSSSTNGGGRMPGMAKSVSTTTQTINGKTVMTRKTTITHGDGTKDVSEEVVEDGKKMEKKYSLQPGESGKGRLKY